MWMDRKGFGQAKADLQSAGASIRAGGSSVIVTMKGPSAVLLQSDGGRLEGQCRAAVQRQGGRGSCIHPIRVLGLLQRKERNKPCLGGPKVTKAKKHEAQRDEAR
ncbi:hypothetical protein THAOC_12425 [Thalassiosira oceanica]|uniref:Uncharacterized protein n=1 Tax=Thalassiosira oceanica TaxID=159749 RepID=K0SMP0_THAOC|nr:hypothetical protein THAOC_12425 [Thalassiosira oceanica]|eukprot:EJK66640.1 hypothetical protein THAOC_12425 [Thalassiosira oceanica]